jgi:aryl-alcohol dehydrogenase-like predicted oxidoreductase
VKLRSTRSGAGRAARSRRERVHHNDPEQSAPAIDALIAIADEIGSNPGRIAIAWVRAKSGAGVHSDAPARVAHHT